MLSLAERLSHNSAGIFVPTRMDCTGEIWEKQMSELLISFPRWRNYDCSCQFRVFNSALFTHEREDILQKLSSDSLPSLPPTLALNSVALTPWGPTSLSTPGCRQVVYWVGGSARTSLSDRSGPELSGHRQIMPHPSTLLRFPYPCQVERPWLPW